MGRKWNGRKFWKLGMKLWAHLVDLAERPKSDLSEQIVVSSAVSAPEVLGIRGEVTCPPN